jgi:very-short-patch-repair endonuclease
MLSLLSLSNFYHCNGVVGMIIFFIVFFAIAMIWISYRMVRNMPQYSEHIPIDRELIKCISPIERRLYNALKFNGYYVRTQVPCGKYRIDLALPTYLIAIECDGKAYHSTPEQKEHDRRKNAYLKQKGWKVLRFSGSMINGNLGRVLKKIRETIGEQ